MGEEKLDNTVYLIRGLYDLADMAARSATARTYAWARNLARSAASGFEAAWWMPEVPQHADSLNDPGGGPNVQQQDQHWIGVTPMEAELTIKGRRPGLATANTATRRWPCARPTATAARARTTSACSTPAAAAARPARASARSSASTRRSRPSARATTAASAPTSSGATPTRTPSRCSTSRARAARPTSSPARCRRSCPRRTSTDRPARREHRPLLDLPRDVHAGVGALRHGLAGGAPAARRAARHGPRAARGRAAAAVRASRASPGGTSAWATAPSPCPRARRRHLPDRGQACARAAPLRHRPHAAARREVQRVRLDGQGRVPRPRRRTAASRCWCDAPASGAATSSSSRPARRGGSGRVAQRPDLGEADGVAGRVAEPGVDSVRALLESP